MKSSEKKECMDESQNYERLAIKGFQWLEERVDKSETKALGSTGFKNFKIEDEKKKWKKKKCKCFQGLGEKISKIIKCN